MTHKTLSVELGRAHAAVRGRDAYPLLQAVGCRPIWSALSKAWMAQRHRGTDVVALAERRGYVVDVREVRAPPRVTPVTPDLEADAIEPAVDLFGEAV